MKISFIGHSCFMIEEGKYSLIIDPFIKYNPVAEIEVSDIKPSHILVSHGHDDHKGDAAEIARNSGAKIITTNELGIEFGKCCIEVIAGHIGGRAKTEFGSVKLFQAFHGSGIKGGFACGFVIDIGGKKIYHAGDTGLTKDMELLKYENIDYALLPIGDFYTMGPEDAVRAAKMIEAKYVIPMHYNTFEGIKQDPLAFKENLEKESNIKAIIMKPGESIDI